MSKIILAVFVFGLLALANCEAPRFFNSFQHFERQELPAAEPDSLPPYPPAGNAPELPFEPSLPPQEYGPPPIPAAEYGPPATSYGAPPLIEEPESERVVVIPAPVKYTVRHSYRLPVHHHHSERIIVPSHIHHDHHEKLFHSQKLISIPNRHHIHSERLVETPYHGHQFHSERLVDAPYHGHHFHSERLVDGHHVHSERLVDHDHHDHLVSPPATVLRIRVSS